MGTLKKKPTTPTPPKLEAPSILVPGRDFDLGALHAITEKTRVLADDYETVLETIGEDVCVPQRVMRVAFDSSKLAEQAGRFQAHFREFAMNHRSRPGGFAHEAEDGLPLVVLSFPSTGGAISPKWKDEAIRLGRELAELKGEEFDETRFENEIRARYKPGKIGTSLSLTEAV